MSFLKVFNKPHYSSTLSLRGLTHSAVVTVIVMSIAFILKPFGLKNLDSSALLEVVVTIGGITFLMMLLAEFIFPFLIKDFYKESSWTTGKQLSQLIIMSVLISIGSVAYLNAKNLAVFPTDALILIGASILPLIGLAIIQQNMLKSKFERLAEDKNHSLKRKGMINSNNPAEVLSFGSLTLIPNQLIYVNVQDNNAEFYYQNLFGLEKTNVNISREKILKQLQGHPQFTSLNASLIVNINAIQQVTGTARGYEVQIAKVNKMVQIATKERKSVENL